MCGFTGFWGSTVPSRDVIERMTKTLIHRGPDDQGVWMDHAAGIALGHRRLSILDLSPQGHQPMASECGRYVISFNGEIYNYAAIRRELDLHSSVVSSWRGHSDTEVMLAAIREWGLENAIKKFVGMFAFALWDRREQCLYLARDRLGEKPVYYGWGTNCFLFGSELKSLRAHPAWRGEIDRGAVALLLRLSYIPSPLSIYENVFKLPPGTILKVKSPVRCSGDPEPTPYWSLREVVHAGVSCPFPGSDSEAIEHLDSKLRETVRLQMVADVPLGAFLSGGIDSSTIVALMQAQSPKPIKTFTIGFKESAYNEAGYAAEVAKHLHTEHTELYISPRDALDVIPKLPKLYDEPFSDSSQIPTYLVSELTKRHVTVSLSGDGGDELFGGYPRYLLQRDLWTTIGWIPRTLRSFAADALNVVPSEKWDAILRFLLPDGVSARINGDRLRRLAEVLPADRLEAMHLGLISHWQDPESIVLMAREPKTSLRDERQWASLPDSVSRMMFLDSISYLPDDILVKVDRAAMGVGLETRVPFLDHRIVEFVWSLPPSMKIRGGTVKWLLKRVLDRYIPRRLMDRPKMGFGVPIDSWLRGPLRAWAESLLDERRLRQEGFFDPVPIRRKWEEHLSGRYNWQYYLWDVLMFQAWLESQSNVSLADTPAAWVA